MMFTDTKKISEAGAWVHVMDGRKPAYREGPDGKPDKTRPIRILMYGPDSPTLQARARKRVAARIKQRGGSLDMAKMSQSQIEALLDENANAIAENMADATASWENMPAPDGGDLEPSMENALWLYEAYPAIALQLQNEVGGLDDFLALAKVSSNSTPGN